MSGKLGSASFTVLLVDGCNLLGAKPKACSWKNEAVEEKSDGLGDGFEAMSPTGLSKLSLTQAGAFFDDTTNGMHDAFKSKEALSRIVCAGYAGNVIGARAIGAFGLYAQTYEVLGSQPNLTKANVTYQVSGGIENGFTLQEWATRTDDWFTATEGHAVDNGASSANGGAGYLQISNFLGVNGGVATILHSDDGNVWSTLITFVTVTGFPQAQRIAVAGTIKRFLAFQWAGFGNRSPSQSASASVSPSVSASVSSSVSLSPSTSISPSGSTSLSPSASVSPSASTSLSPSSSRSPSVSASASTSFSLSPSVSASASASPSSGGQNAGAVTVFVMFARV